MAATDVLTIPEALAALPGLGSSGTRDAEIELYNAAVAEALDNLCGPIVQRTVTEYHHSGSTIVLDHTPVGAITSVTERVALTSTAINVATLAVTGRIIERPSNSFSAGPRSLTVVYVAGRYANIAAVSPLFKLAARLYLQAIWRPAEGGGSETFGGVPSFPVAAPDEVLALLGHELRGPVFA